MPRTPDASSVTTFRRVQATIPADPTIKSRTFVAVQKDGYQSSILRATQEGQSAIRSDSVLAVPAWVSPQFKGRFFLR